ncbi:MAG: glycerol-3-phosphate dehydrogenase [Chlamydiae bacterium]|nr:glycerol-3-phosphate dehydrogenase [Chlamydiota bacterium]MBI3278064.1 glycerol-3-phosphate dehydrogenase [Chlamydiota bacterium]
MNSKPRELSHLKTTLFDLLIIGGGINGAGIARDGALRGFKVCLIEKGDFASGTSSKTSKLVHGGLRYLEHGDFKLVYEALQERHHLLKIAPHLVHPLSFFLPIYQGDSRGVLKVKLGLTLYDCLSGKRNIQTHKNFPLSQLSTEVPQINLNGLKKTFHFYDAQMNDARLCLENILSAVESGACAFNYFNAVRFLEKEGRVSGILGKDLISNQEFEIHAKLVINATGPWIDQLLAKRTGSPQKKLRLAKGIHIILPRLTKEHAFLLTAQQDGRVFFSLPWRDFTLVGTTDTDFSGDPDHVTAEIGEIQYLLLEIQRIFPGTPLSRKDIISTFAGVRPLIHEERKKLSEVSREYRIEETSPGLLSILGGKFTTYRSLAERAVNQATQILHLHQNEPCRTALLSLPGGGKIPTVEEFSKSFDLDQVTIQHLLATYGSRALEVAKTAKEWGTQGQLCPHHPHMKAELLYAFTHEMAQTLDDFFTRRTLIRYTPCRGILCMENIVKILSGLSLFSEEELQTQKENYLRSIKKDK